jgi:hypothetical protein
MTTRVAVARYWTSNEGHSRWRSADVDIGEPSCMACGYFAHHWDKARTVDERWNKSSLERAHIVAASSGGPDLPSNYVLLCAKCHAAAPMTHDERVMFAWCDRRPSYTAAQVNELRNELVGLGIDLHSLAPLASLPLDELRERLNKAAGTIGAGLHLCHMSASTRAAALARMAEELAESTAAPKRGDAVESPRQLSLFGGDR